MYGGARGGTLARRELLALTLCAAAGCGGFLGFGDDGDDAPPTVSPPSSPTTVADGGDAADGASDGSVPTACDPNAPWGTPVLIPELSTADGQEAALTLSADERTIYLQRDVASVPTILTGTRAA